MTYRVYVTDALQNAPQGKFINRRWYDIANPAETQDAETVIASLVEKGAFVYE